MIYYPSKERLGGNVLNTLTDEKIRNFQKEHGINLTEDQLLIFKLGYNLRQKELEEANKEITEVIKIKIKQLRGMDIYEECERLAENLNIKCKINYVTQRLGFPFNTQIYRLILTGKKADVLNFKKAMWG